VSAVSIFENLVEPHRTATIATTITACPPKYKPAHVDIQAVVSTNLEGCPLLEEPGFRILADKHLSGTEFAYPMPGTSVSGRIIGGTVELGQRTIRVQGRTESAMRLFPEASAANPSFNGVFISGVSNDGIPIVSGAAATIVSLQGIDSRFKLQLVLSDRFTINMGEYPMIDTEDFHVIGAHRAKVTGRLRGVAEIWDPPPAPMVDAPFTVQGKLCIRR
jgi:hypothetical protein